MLFRFPLFALAVSWQRRPGFLRALSESILHYNGWIVMKLMMNSGSDGGRFGDTRSS